MKCPLKNGYEEYRIIGQVIERSCVVFWRYERSTYYSREIF